MKLNQYQKKAITTKMYDDSVAIAYIVLGICGESAELYEKIVEGDTSEGNLELLSKEIGDVAWYLAGWAEENKLKLESIAKFNTVQSSEGQVSIHHLNDQLVLYSGQIAEYTKKALRDNFDEISVGVYPADKLVKVNIAVANLLETIKGIAFYFLLSFDEILEDNIEKLRSRAERGKIGGSGDVR